MLFQSTATVEYRKGCLRGVIDEDIARYYRALYYFESWNTIKMWRARYGTHITIYNPRFHDEHEYADKNALLYHGVSVLYSYNPEEIFRGGQWFTGYYLPIYSDDIERIKRELRLVERPGFKGLHISLFTDKHENTRPNPLT